MRNPNGYGSVVKLSGNRRRPYVIRKTVGWDDRGYPIYAVLGYAETWEEANMMLATYNNDPWDISRAQITLGELLELWKIQKAPKLGDSSRKSLLSASKHCTALFDRPYRSIKAYQMQGCIDNCGRGYSTQALVKNFWKRMDDFALEMDIITRRYSDLLTSDPVPETSRGRFSDAEIDILWAHKDDPWIDTALILIYSGWRISELLALRPEDIDLQKGIMVGGTKTAAGKGRVVPIHSLIRPFVERRLKEGGSRLVSFEGKTMTPAQFRKMWQGALLNLGIDHVPHECRHTFESLLDSAGANRRCIDLMMGHKSADTGNRVYNHKTIKELRDSLELVTH